MSKNPLTPSASPPATPKARKLNSGYLKTPDPNTPSTRKTSWTSPSGKRLSATLTPYETSDRLTRTPQYFSPKKLFDESPNKSELSEISNQLRNKLSSALGKIQHDKAITFSLLTFVESPTKKLKSSLQESPPRKLNSSMGESPKKAQETLAASPFDDKRRSLDESRLRNLQRANLNLQTLQQSPNPPTFNPLQQSPIFKDESPVNPPSPDEDSSAHNALMAALNRRKKQPQPVKLPSLNVALKNSNESTEQDAVLSLMSLSSPQSIKFGHSRNPSSNGSPEKLTPGPSPRVQLKDDDDATDIEDDDTETDET